MKFAKEVDNKVISVKKYATDEIYRVDTNMNTIITDVSNEITNINSSLGNTSTDINSINTSMLSLQEQVNVNASDISMIKEDILKINKNIETILELLNQTR